MAAAEDAVAASTTALDKARRQYEEVSDRVVREFARFRRDKAADMKKIILDYVNVQVRKVGSLESKIFCCLFYVTCRDVYPMGQGSWSILLQTWDTKRLTTSRDTFFFFFFSLPATRTTNSSTLFL